MGIDFYAKGLNRNAIMDAIRKSRCYISENSNISLGLKISTLHPKKLFASIGDTLSVHQGDKLSILCNVKGIADSSMVILISNNGIEHVFN